MFKNKLRSVFLSSILLLCFILFTSCGSTPQIAVVPKTDNGKVTLRCALPYDISNNSEAFKNFTSDIKRVFPDYDISLSLIKGDSKAYETKIKVLLSSDSAPDVFFSDDGRFTDELRGVKAIEALDQPLEKSSYWDIVIPSAKDIGANGRLYAVPYNEVSYGIMEINTELFSKNNVKIPENFDELKTAVDKFKEKGITPIAIGGKDGAAVYRMVESFAYTIDSDITTKIISGKETFSSDTFKQAAEAVNLLRKLGAFEEKAEGKTDADAANLFYSGKAAIYCTTSKDLGISYTKLGGKSTFLYYPSINGTKQPDNKAAISGGIKKDSGLLISSSSKYTKEAVKLAIEVSKYYNKFLYEKQNNLGVIYIPHKMVWKPAENAIPSMKKFMSSVAEDKNVKSGLFENNISSAKIKAIQEDSAIFMTGLLSVDNYLKEMDNGMKVK